ncbi:hypothetical protein [Undibacterium pigrum]|uniref:ElaB/YqjD/DUF883 family membrane-anchored ribosome-binding protein n=1 Tax=Undibacterium pigrum TaxID=401470 RepID=A0A318JH31_9BURK|nr:hypothetical protein [Undibacterium pigrum]PXX43038.1 hypothetical protein DFR42_10438 [Undibacterium pigrum]
MPTNTTNATPAANETAADINHPSIPFPTSDKPPSLVEQVQEKTAEAVKPVAEKITALKEQAASKLNTGTNQAITKLCDHSEKLYLSQAKLLDTCRVKVRKQPMTILGVTVATVVALGVLFHRQTR